MKWLREKLHRNDSVYFILLAILAIGFVFTDSYRDAMAPWTSPVISTMLLAIAAIFTITYFKVLKEKYLTRAKQMDAQHESQFEQLKTELITAKNQLEAEQKKHALELQNTMTKLDAAYADKFKELFQTMDVHKQKLIVQLTEKAEIQIDLANQQFTTLSAALAKKAEGQLKRMDQAESNLKSTLEQQAIAVKERLTDANTRAETNMANLVSLIDSNQEKALENAEQNVIVLSERMQQTEHKSLEQTKASEQLLIEILTTLSKNILVASNMMKESLAKNHDAVIMQLDDVKVKQETLLTESHDELIQRVVYLLDQLNAVSKGLQQQTEQSTKVLLDEVVNKGEAVLAVLEQKDKKYMQTVSSLKEANDAQQADLQSIIDTKFTNVLTFLENDSTGQSEKLMNVLHELLQALQQSTADLENTTLARTQLVLDEVQHTAKQHATALDTTKTTLLEATTTQFSALQADLVEGKQEIDQHLAEAKSNVKQSYKLLSDLGDEHKNQIVSGLQKANIQLTGLESNMTKQTDQLKQSLLQQIISLGKDVTTNMTNQTTTISSRSDKLGENISLLASEVVDRLNNQLENSDNHFKMLQQAIGNVPKEQNTSIQQLEKALLNELTSQTKQSIKEWKNIKEQQVVQLKEARAFVANKVSEQRQQLEQSMKKQQTDLQTLLDKVLKNIQSNFSASVQEVKTLLTKMQQEDKNQHQNTLNNLSEITAEMNGLNSELLKQFATVTKEIAKNDVQKFTTRIENFSKQVEAIKTSITTTNQGLTSKISAVQKEVAKGKDIQSPELVHILQTVSKFNAQFKEHNELLIDRIDYIEKQISAMQALAASTNATSIKAQNTTSSRTQPQKQAKTKPVSETKSPTVTATVIEPAQKKDQENRVEIVEDKAAGIKMQNKYVKGVLRQSDMMQQGKISYTAFYSENGALQTTVNYDKNGKRQTEMNYYPIGAVKERIEYTVVKGKPHTEVSKFDLNGKRLK